MTYYIPIPAFMAYVGATPTPSTPTFVADESGGSMDDKINPSHYRAGQIETIDFIEEKGLGYHLGNAVKYITRAGLKSPDTFEEDLRKAIWYLERAILKEVR